MRSLIEILKALPLISDAVKGLISLIQKGIEAVRSKKLKRKVKEAMQNENREQASRDLDDLFRDD